MRTDGETESRRSGHSTKAAWLTGGLLFLIASGLVGIISGGSQIGVGQRHLARVDVDGPILDSEPLVELLDEARKKGAIQGVVIRINSPGGGVGASQAIYEAVGRLAEEKPVAVSMGDVAASGGYMVALGADRVFALESTLTGSIGVIMMSTGVYPVMERIGIEPRIIKSGRFKDAGSPFRAMEEKDRAYLQSLVDQLHRQFVDLLAQEREIRKAKAEELADGRVFTGQQAEKKGLIDGLGGFQEAEAWVRKEAEVGPDVTVKELRPPRDWWQALAPDAFVGWSQWLLSPQPRFLYRSPGLTG